MANADSELERKLAEVRQAYVEKLPLRLEDIRAHFEQARAGDPDAFATLHRLVHSLTGSAGTFGFHDLSMLARVIERSIKAQLSQANSLGTSDAQRLASKLGELETAIHQLSAAPQDAHVAPHEPSNENHPLIYILEANGVDARELATQLDGFGYRAAAFVEGRDLAAAIANERPSAIVAPIHRLNQSDNHGLDMLAEIRRKWRSATPPVVFLSDSADLNTQLAAVRAEGAAFFTRPVNLGELVDKLDFLTHRVHAVPYRVLVVDDDDQLANHYALVLKRVGIEARALTQPLHILETIDEFKPELILMDVYMPECTGVELARVIRQNTAYIGIPIMFLSAETATDKQFHALSQGADGFLTKPIADDDLVNSVLARADRSRAISAHLIKDSLTGLLNHSNSKDTAAAEFQRAQRAENPLSCVMIDIDRFKGINDTYGHMMGDQVIAALSRLLQQRLRDTDVVGRYGGEEFIVLMPNTPPDAAYHVIDELRTRFSEMEHGTGQHTFTATFSAGVSDSTVCKNTDALINAADEALYSAKQSGRDQVRIARECLGDSGS